MKVLFEPLSKVLKSGFYGIVLGSIIGVTKGDTRSSVYGSFRDMYGLGKTGNAHAYWSNRWLLKSL